MKTKKKLALSVVELLVIFAIMGTLAAILLPALSKARESSRGSGRGYYPGLSEDMGMQHLELTGAVDELWVIERSAAQEHEDQAAEESPSQGQLVAMVDQEEVAVPLEHTAVNGQVSAFIATVDVTQQFTNPYDTKIEAEYVFPLPHNAAVTDFLMTVGERKIRGMIRKSEEAQKIYEKARAAGYVASLLTQERPNIFREKVANIEPGKRIDINITYFSPLKYQKGEYEFVFPMVVAPRFNPPGSTDGVGAVARQQKGFSGQSTEVQYLAPDERSGHDISLAIDIDAGVEIEDVFSNSHAIDVDRVRVAEHILDLDSGVDVDRERDVVAAAFVGRQILHLGTLAREALLLAGDRADAVRRARRIKTRGDNHREDKLVLAFLVLERAEVGDVDVDPLARLDIGHFLAENVGPLLCEKRGDISRGPSFLVDLLGFLALANHAADLPLADGHQKIGNSRVMGQRKHVFRFDLRIIRISELLRDIDRCDKRGDLPIDGGVLEWHCHFLLIYHGDQLTL